MYRIFGSDGKEYGPIPGEQVRQWIREGRAGGATLARLEGNTEWKALHSLPEFADVFPAPVLTSGGATGSLPPVVRTFGVLSLVFGVVGLLYMTFAWISLVVAVRHSPDLKLFTTTYFAYQVIGVAGVVIQLVGGVGLLRGREWARKLTVYYAIFATLMGIWGLGKTFYWLMSSDASVHLLGAPQFLFSMLFSVASLAFHVAAIVFLSRKEVRAALVERGGGSVR